MFEVVHSPVHVGWYPVNYTNATASTCYVGQLVVCGPTGSTNGVKPWIMAGVADTTADHVPFGVVIGTNNRTPLYSSTYLTEYITAVRTQAAQLARDWYGVEGQYGKGDPAAMVQVAVLGPQTVLKGRIWNAAVGTAIGVDTATAASTDGTALTASASDFTPVAYKATYYCRSGANAGLYRANTYDTSTTTHTFYGPDWPYDIAIGDTFVSSNLVVGTTTMGLDTSAPGGLFINNAAAVTTTDYIFVDVLALNLEKPGEEYAIFKINPLQYLGVRA